MTDASLCDDERVPTEEVKVYCDEGDGEKKSSENFTLEGIGLLAETAQKANANQEIGFNAFPFGPTGFPNWNAFGVLAPVVFHPYMYPQNMGPQFFPRQPFPMPPGFPGYLNPQFMPPVDLKPMKMDSWPPNMQSSRPKDHEKADTRSRPYVKKPLNAFMIYMREKRNEIMIECTMKESASVNQILGKKWHQLDKVEQNKYYELARDEKEKHKQLHPDWSARDNYASRVKKRRFHSPCLTGEDITDCSSMKKCRALLGIKQRQLWCKHCRGKKKCLRNGDCEDLNSEEYKFESLTGQSTPVEINSVEYSTSCPDTNKEDDSPLMDTPDVL